MNLTRYDGLRLLVFCIRPLTPCGANDGSQAILLDMLRHFGSLGVRVTVYCSRRRDLAGEYRPFPGVTVRPALRFNDAGRDPYWTAPFHLAEVVDIMRAAAKQNDLLYIHDSNLRFDYVGEELPTTAAIFDLVYPHSVAGAVNFSRDRLVTISDYTGACLRETFRRFRPLPDGVLNVVRSGFSTDRFSPRDTARLRTRLGLAEDAIPILFPHRPDQAKGLRDALLAVLHLKNRLPAADYARVQLLVSDWQESSPSPEATARSPEEVYPEPYQYAAEVGVEDKLHVHPWIPRADMPEYYSTGVATLCTGTFPEAFGNVHVESMLCGTPAVVSRVAAHRTTVPEQLARKVDPGDAEAAADHLAEVISKRERTGAALLAYLTEKYSLGGMLRGYERAILECRHGPPAPLAEPPESCGPETRLRTPPWAARLHAGYYHDYSGYCTDPVLLPRLPLIAEGCRVADLLKTGVQLADVHRWLSEGLVVSRPAVAADLPPAAGDVDVASADVDR